MKENFPEWHKQDLEKCVYDSRKIAILNGSLFVASNWIKSGTLINTANNIQLFHNKESLHAESHLKRETIAVNK